MLALPTAVGELLAVLLERFAYSYLWPSDEGRITDAGLAAPAADHVYVRSGDVTSEMHHPDSLDEKTKMVVSELQRLYDRMDQTNDSTTTVIQFIVLVFGAAALSADKFPAAIVAMPIFWTVWLLYAVLTDHNTLKYAAVAAHLERVVNSRLGVDAFV